MFVLFCFRHKNRISNEAKTFAKKCLAETVESDCGIYKFASGKDEYPLLKDVDMAAIDEHANVKERKRIIRVSEAIMGENVLNALDLNSLDLNP